MEKDVLDEPQVKAFLERFRSHVLPRIKASDLTVTIVSHDPDPKMCLEVGAAVLLDKPILVVALDAAKIPPTLRKVATSIVVVSDLNDETDKARLQEAISRVVNGGA